GQVLARMSSTERAALLDAASARGAEELKRWQEFYRAAPIMAPIDGTIIARNVEPGQSFTTADAVLVMSDRLTVKAQVDETDIADIKLGQRADIVLDAYPDHHMPSKVDAIAYDATTINNVTTYIVDVLPDETPPFMRSGMTANVRFAVSSKEGVLTLPVGAVTTKGGKSTVLTPPASPVGKPEERKIKIGESDGRLVEIASGLSEGDLVLAPRSKKGRSDATSSPFSPFRPGRTR
nr:efflux RND transporter periplasmic adaptor subunit [bacterium]